MKIFRIITLSLVSPLLLLAAACTPRAAYPPPSSYPSPPPGQPEDGRLPPEYTPPPAEAPLPPRSAAEMSGPAVMALISRSEQKAKNGDLDSAAASLERALDLEPRNPFVYQKLATLRLEQGQAEQSEALARKANSLAGNNPFIKAANWRVVAQARSIRGDSVGASSASSRADYYSDIGKQLSNGPR